MLYEVITGGFTKAGLLLGKGHGVNSFVFGGFTLGFVNGQFLPGAYHVSVDIVPVANIGYANIVPLGNKSQVIARLDHVGKFNKVLSGSFGDKMIGI